MVSVLEMSEPAACSVMNIEPWTDASKSIDSSWGRYFSTSFCSPYFFSVRVSESVIDNGQQRPNSDCTNR